MLLLLSEGAKEAAPGPRGVLTSPKRAPGSALAASGFSLALAQADPLALASISSSSEASRGLSPNSMPEGSAARTRLAAVSESRMAPGRPAASSLAPAQAASPKTR